MPKPPVTPQRFPGMAKGVAKVEHLPQTALALIPRHNARLQPNAIAQQAADAAFLPRQHGRQLLLQKPEQARRADDRALHHLIQTRSILARRQAAQRAWIGQHRQRRVERAQQVLPGAQVHAGLTSDSAVNLPHQRGRQLHVGNPAHVAGGQEAGYVAHHTAPQRRHQRRAVSAAPQQLLRQLLHRAQPLALLAVVHEQNLGTDAGCAHAPRQLPAPQRPYAGRADNEKPPAAGTQPPQPLPGLPQQARPHPDRIVGAGRPHSNGLDSDSQFFTHDSRH